MKSQADTTITPQQVAQQLGISNRTLANWRSTGYPNLPYLKLGRCVRYRQSDIDAFLKKHTFCSEEG